MNLIQIAQAAEGSLVSCTGGDCGVCGVLQTFSNIYNYFLGISFAVAVLILVTAGYFYIFTTGRKRYLQKAKIFAKNGIIGFVLILVGWVVIHTLFYLSGYQNDSWWQFSCESESAVTADYQAGSLKSINAYANIADFIASGNTQGIIREPVSEAVFQNQIKQLKTGETLTFYLPAKKNSGSQEEILVPFLAGYKSGSGLKMDSKTISLLTNLIKSISGNNISLLGSAGSILSNPTALINKLITALMPSLAQGSGLNLSGANLDKAIETLSGAVAGFKSDGTAMGDLTAAMTNKVMEVKKEATNDSGIVIAKNEEKTASSGDRSDTKGYDSDKWKNTQNQDNLKQNQDYKNLPSTQGENPVGPKDNIDQIKDKSKDDQKMCDYSKATNPVEEALIRIECKDELRYNMIHRFVKKISNTDFQGGFCEGCGEIAVNFSFPRELLDQLIIHESTHAGQFCLGLIDMSQPAKVEREACANQMGSLCKDKHDENGGIGTDDYVMQEITCSGGKDDQTGKIKGCRQKPHIEYRGGDGGKGQEEIRGYLSRWTTMVNPSGDLKCEAYDWPVKYALGPHGPQQQRDTTMGPYHYGAHVCGEQRVLGLKQEENEDVKKIVKSQEDCKSKARPNLPKAMECEQSGGGPIEIDSSKKSPGGM